MRILTSSRLTALGAALAVAAAALPVGSLGSGAGAVVTPLRTTVAAVQTPVVSSAPVSAGTLTMTTSKTKGLVQWGGLSQGFASSPLGNCRLVSTEGSAALLDFVGQIGNLTSSAGFKNGSIGVYEFKHQGGPPWNAAQCNEVDDGSFTSSETLGVHLGSDAEDTFGALIATRATLQLVANTSKGSLRATLVDDSGNALSTRSITWSKKGAIDAGSFTGEFSGILLKVTKGSFSLTGASFDVASQADDFFCTEGSDDTFTNDEGVTVTFIGNADGSPCEGFGIKLGRDGDAQVHFIKPLDVNPEAQFIFTVPWDTVVLTEPSMLPEVFIDFEVPYPNGPNEREMPYCPDYLFDETGTLVGMPDASSPEYASARLDLDSRDMEKPEIEGVLQTLGTQFACIGVRDAGMFAGPDFEATITDTIYLIGDARMLMR